VSDKIPGVVKWFDADRGYGFLSRDDRATDVFVHIRAVERANIDTLRRGDRCFSRSRPIAPTSGCRPSSSN
jgi:CspA family cold shock protein